MSQYTSAAYCDPDTCHQYGTAVVNSPSSSSCISGDCSQSSSSQPSKALSSSISGNSAVSSTPSSTRTLATTTKPTHSVLSAVKTSSEHCTSGHGCISSGNNQSHMPDGAKIGIGIGVGVGFILLVVVLVVLFPIRQQQQRRKRLGVAKAVEVGEAGNAPLPEPQEVKGSPVHEMSAESQVAEMNGERG